MQTRQTDTHTTPPIIFFHLVSCSFHSSHHRQVECECSLCKSALFPHSALSAPLTNGLRCNELGSLIASVPENEFRRERGGGGGQSTTSHSHSHFAVRNGLFYNSVFPFQVPSSDSYILFDDRCYQPTIFANQYNSCVGSQSITAAVQQSPFSMRHPRRRSPYSRRATRLPLARSSRSPQ